MKSTLLFVPGIFLMFNLHAQEVTQQAQQPPAPVEVEKLMIKVDEATEKMSQGYNSCLKVFIPEALEKDVERDFAKYMKDFNAKADEKKGEYFFDNAVIKQFGNNPVDVYSTATQQDKGVLLEVFFDLGGSYLNSRDHGNKFEIATRMLRDFAKRETNEAVQNQIDAEQKILQSKMKEHEDLVKQDTMYQRKIRESQQIIQDSQAGIKLAEEKQITKKKEIEDQQLLLDALKSKKAGIE